MSYIFISSSHYNSGVFVRHVTYLDKERKKERKKHRHKERKKESQPVYRTGSQNSIMFEWNETKTIHPHSPYLNCNGFKIYRWFNLIQDSLLVKRRNDNHSPRPVIRELVPSSHQSSELSNTILCIFIRWDQRIGEGIPIPDSLGEEATFINICISNGSLKCHRVLISITPSFGDKVIYWYTALPLRPLFNSIAFPPFLEGFPF